MAGAQARSSFPAVGGSFMESPTAGSREPDLLAEVFHALNQPMAGLRCTLEAALAKNRSPEQYRQYMETALKKAGEIERWTRGVSEFVLADAAVPLNEEQKRQSLSLKQYLRECVDDLALVADSSRVRCEVNIAEDHPIWFSPRILKPALFRIHEFALAEVKDGGIIAIRDVRLAVAITLEYVLQRSGAIGKNVQDERQQRRQQIWMELSFATAQRLLETAGGRLTKEILPEETKIRLHLPLAQS